MQKIRNFLNISCLGEIKNKYGSGALIFENACKHTGNMFFIEIISEHT